MSLYLLDTNTCVEVLRNRNQHVVRRFTATAPNDVRLCSVVKGELLYGARKGPRPTTNLATPMATAIPVTEYRGYFAPSLPGSHALGLMDAVWEVNRSRSMRP